MAAALVPIGLEIGELLATTLASQGVGKLAQAVFDKGASGAARDAEEAIMRMGKKMYNDMMTQKGRDGLIKGAQKIGMNTAKGVDSVTNFLSTHKLLDHSTAQRLNSRFQKGNTGFQKMLGKVGRINYKVSKMF